MNNSILTAVLVDTVSIQQYIFSSNKLKENIGASFIIEELIFKDTMMNLLREMFPSEQLHEKWDDTENDYVVQITQADEIKCEIGYIGGGNALVLFKDEKPVTENAGKATQFIQKYTLELLQRFPGLRTAFSLLQFDFNYFRESLDKLFEILIINKSAYFPQTAIPKHGITVDCALSNEAAEYYYQFGNKQPKEFISRVSKARFDSARQLKEGLHDKFPFLNNHYTLTENIERLGQPKEKGYIAVVHIDGNSMGKRFAEKNSLEEIRKLSKAVDEASKNAMNKFGEYVIKCIKDKKISKETGFELEEENGVTNLPFRPIISGGDDITFVCDGRLGFHFAEKFIHYLTENGILGESFYACAGIAIVKTHYPFFRAVKLAEELCGEAKRSAREVNGSYLNFYISSSGFSGSLEQVFAASHQAPEGSLHFGPYKLLDNQDNKSVLKLKENLRFFRNEWPRNKVMELREILMESKADFEYFKKEMETRQRKLPDNYFDNKFMDNAFEDKDGEQETPYYDIIDLLDFYPEKLLTDED